MRSPAETVDEMNATIAHMHQRIATYVGSCDAPGAGDVIDGLMWQIHHWRDWIAQSGQFSRELETVRQSHPCGPLSFAVSFRRRHPGAPERDVCRQALACWQEVSVALGIDVTADQAERD